MDSSIKIRVETDSNRDYQKRKSSNWEKLRDGSWREVEMETTKRVIMRRENRQRRTSPREETRERTTWKKPLLMSQVAKPDNRPQETKSQTSKRKRSPSKSPLRERIPTPGASPSRDCSRERTKKSRRSLSPSLEDPIAALSANLEKESQMNLKQNSVHSPEPLQRESPSEVDEESKPSSVAEEEEYEVVEDEESEQEVHPYPNEYDDFEVVEEYLEEGDEETDESHCCPTCKRPFT